jgi:hypothetical protein
VYSCDFRILPELLQNPAACQNLWGFTGWRSHDVDHATKGGVPLGVLCQQNRVKAAGAEQWRKNPPAVISRSVMLVIPDKGFSQNGRRGRLEHRETMYGPGESRGATGNRAAEPCWGQSLSQEQREIEELIEAAVR